MGACASTAPPIHAKSKTKIDNIPRRNHSRIEQRSIGHRPRPRSSTIAVPHPNHLIGVITGF